MKKLKPQRAYAGRSMAPPVRPAADRVWAIVGAELPSPKGNLLFFIDFCPFEETRGADFGWEDLAAVEPTRRIFAQFAETVSARLVGGLRLMGLFVETLQPLDAQLPFLKANIHSQLQLIGSEKLYTGSEFFLWLRTGADSRLYGVKMANGSGVYKPPKFIDVDDLLQFHHLFFRDTLAVPLPIGSTFSEFLSEKSNWHQLQEALVGQFKAKMAKGVFAFGQQIGGAGTPLPEVEGCVRPLVQDSVEALESDPLGNVNCVRLRLDLCALVLKETTLADNLGAFTDDFQRTLLLRMQSAVEGLAPPPLQAGPGATGPTTRFYLTKGWTRLSAYPSHQELAHKQALRSTFHDAFSSIKSAPTDSFVVSSNDI